MMMMMMMDGWMVRASRRIGVLELCSDYNSYKMVYYPRLCHWKQCEYSLIISNAFLFKIMKLSIML